MSKKKSFWYVASKEVSTRLISGYKPRRNDDRKTTTCDPGLTNVITRKGWPMEYVRKEIGKRITGTIATLSYREQAMGNRRFYLSDETFTSQMALEIHKDFPLCDFDSEVLKVIHDDVVKYASENTVKSEWGTLKTDGRSLYVDIPPYNPPPKPKGDVKVIIQPRKNKDQQ